MKGCDVDIVRIKDTPAEIVKEVYPSYNSFLLPQSSEFPQLASVIFLLFLEWSSLGKQGLPVKNTLCITWQKSPEEVPSSKAVTHHGRLCTSTNSGASGQDRSVESTYAPRQTVVELSYGRTTSRLRVRHFTPLSASSNNP